MKKASSTLLLISLALGLLLSFFGVIFSMLHDGYADGLSQLFQSVIPSRVLDIIATHMKNSMFTFSIAMIISGAIGFVMSSIALVILDKAKSTRYFKGIAIALIVSGIFSTAVQIVAGILMLCIQDDQLQ